MLELLARTTRARVITTDLRGVTSDGLIGVIDASDRNDGFHHFNHTVFEILQRAFRFDGFAKSLVLFVIFVFRVEFEEAVDVAKCSFNFFGQIDAVAELSDGTVKARSPRITPVRPCRLPTGR